MPATSPAARVGEGVLAKAFVATVTEADRKGVALSVLRARLESRSARDVVLLDFLEDDLGEARSAIREVAGWLDRVEEALDDAGTGRQALLALALGQGPRERLDNLGSVLENLRRRIAQASARLPG